MTPRDIGARLLHGDATLFDGSSAEHALGWLRHPQRYLGAWLDETVEQLENRHPRTLVLGMGGSSSSARLYAEARPDQSLSVLDTSNPDSVRDTDFSNTTVIASSKSGTTIETQTLLAHALANGLSARDLVIITDPGTSLGELGTSMNARVIEGDPATGGRFSGLSPFALVPALYAGWTVHELRDELSGCVLTSSLIEEAAREAADRAATRRDGAAFYELGGEPVVSGGALWLEQLIGETTGKEHRGFIPVAGGDATTYRPRDLQRLHLLAVLLARELRVDPFNQPDVELAKREVLSLLRAPLEWRPAAIDASRLHDALSGSLYNALQVYAPLSSAPRVAQLRSGVEAAYGVTTANLGPRYLHSTGQLHKGGPDGVVGVQVVVRPTSAPQRIEGRHYTFHDLHLAQAMSDVRAMNDAGHSVFQLMVDDLDEASRTLGVAT